MVLLSEEQDVVDVDMILRKVEPVRRRGEDAGFAASVTVAGAKELSKWFKDNFAIGMTRTPRGQKNNKLSFERLIRIIGHGRWDTQAEGEWQRIHNNLDEIVKYFSNSKSVPKEIKGKHATYLNYKGLSEKSLNNYVKKLDRVFGDLKGWRKAALTASGGLTVALAGAGDFRGTASGKYKVDKDILYVKATPAITKRDKGYASPEYIVIHELGHRYDYKVRSISLPVPTYYTTRYSVSGGGDEVFAELFALGHFGITETDRKWDSDMQDHFEKMMSKK